MIKQLRQHSKRNHNLCKSLNFAESNYDLNKLAVIKNLSTMPTSRYDQSASQPDAISKNYYQVKKMDFGRPTTTIAEKLRLAPSKNVSITDILSQAEQMEM